MKAEIKENLVSSKREMAYYVAKRTMIHLIVSYSSGSMEARWDQKNISKLLHEKINLSNYIFFSKWKYPSVMKENKDIFK